MRESMKLDVKSRQMKEKNIE